MKLPTELIDLCNKGFVTLGPEGHIVRFSTAKMQDRAPPGKVREGGEFLFYDARVEDDEEANTKNALSNMRDALDAIDDIIKAGFQIDVVSGLMVMTTTGFDT